MDIKQEDLVKFWTWFGFLPITYAQEYPEISTNHPGDIVMWLYPDKDKNYHLPNIDLNNLYQYALPNLEYFEVSGQLYLHSHLACCAMVRTFAGKPQKDTVGGIEKLASGNTPTEALYNAIMKVVNNETRS
jgi:hypothetical protein